ncbi:MAG: DUF3307 domain-containing protein [Cyclobacteriaceae bacterium]
MILLLKLILAHLLSDFILQPESWIREKEFKQQRSPKLYLHAMIHGVLTMLLVWDITFWPPAVVIVVTHYVIDLSKVKFQKAHTKKRWFIIDQLLHIIVLGGVWYYWQRPDFSPVFFHADRNVILFITAAVFLTSPASLIIKILISQWTPDTIPALGASLPDAGKFIGILERFLVFIFVINNHWEAVGFLLAAKSVFRFGNLKESYDRKLTEYVLIGTLLSFSVALAVAILVSAILNDAIPKLLSIVTL